MDLGQPRAKGRRATFRIAAVALGATLVAAACGGSSGSGSASSGGTAGDKALFGGSGLSISPPPPGGGTNPDKGLTPKRGGTMTMATEAEDTNGYCLAEAQLDISGEQVARSIYDTLTVPGADGKYHPYLASAVTSSPDHMTWTIQVRPNVVFHDGSKLTAEVVKNNLDAYRGTYPGRKPLLFIFVLQNIASTTVTGPMTVQVTMKKPWIDFDGFLYSQARLGIMGQAQLDDPAHCQDHLIGTGPFKLAEWKTNERYRLVRNPDYWQKGADGKPLPYLDELDFVPIIDGNQRLQALEAGRVQAILTDGGNQILQLRKDAAAGTATIISSALYAEQGYLLLNATAAPFDDLNLRKAATLAVDFNTINKVVGKNIAPLASAPFPSTSMGYVKGLSFPRNQPAEAKKLVTAWKAAHGGAAPKVTITSTQDTDVQKTVTFLQSYLQAAGFDANIQVLDQAQLINNAVGRKFQMSVFRNHGGIDPDEQYVWWHGGSPVNFGGFKDPVVDCLLDVGRSGSTEAACLADPALRKEDPALASISATNRPAIYQELSRRFASQVWNIWGAYSPWSVGATPKVHGILGPNLPDGTGPWPAFLNGAPVAGFWLSS